MIFKKSSIYSFQIVSVVMPVPRIFLIGAYAADHAAINAKSF